MRDRGRRGGGVALLVAMLLLCLKPDARAQLIIATPIPATIPVGNLDRVITQARNEATRRKQPLLEFEMVKLHVKDVVDRTRYNYSQEVTFTSPGAVHSWLKALSVRLKIPYEHLLVELVEAVGPNPSPDLTGYDRDLDIHLRNRAVESLRRREWERMNVAPAMPPVAAPDEAAQELEKSPAAQPPEPARSPAPEASPRPAGNTTSISIEFSRTPYPRPAPRPRTR